jgi:hypothetical protein
LGFFETEENVARAFDEEAAPLGQPANFDGPAKSRR